MTTKTTKTLTTLHTDGTYTPKPGDTIKLVNYNGATIRKSVTVLRVGCVDHRYFEDTGMLDCRIYLEGGGYVNVNYNCRTRGRTTAEVRRGKGVAVYEWVDTDKSTITPA
jgi:hypothetical protein